MNDPRFGSRMRGEGKWAEIIGDLFTITVDRLGFDREPGKLSTEHFRRSQRELF